jgi:hypothetical protein
MIRRNNADIDPDTYGQAIYPSTIVVAGQVILASLGRAPCCLPPQGDGLLVVIAKGVFQDVDPEIL